MNISIYYQHIVNILSTHYQHIINISTCFNITSLKRTGEEEKGTPKPCGTTGPYYGYAYDGAALVGRFDPHKKLPDKWCSDGSSISFNDIFPYFPGVRFIQ